MVFLPRWHPLGFASSSKQMRKARINLRPARSPKANNRPRHASRTPAFPPHVRRIPVETTIVNHPNAEHKQQALALRTSSFSDVRSIISSASSRRPQAAALSDLPYTEAALPKRTVSDVPSLLRPPRTGRGDERSRAMSRRRPPPCAPIVLGRSSGKESAV